VKARHEIAAIDLYRSPQSTLREGHGEISYVGVDQLLIRDDLLIPPADEYIGAEHATNLMDDPAE
jgi:hypothetical protein